MDTSLFRKDLLKRMKATNLSQTEVSTRFGVDQGWLSLFCREKSGISFEKALLLWSFVYGCDFPEPELPTDVLPSQEKGKKGIIHGISRT